MCVCIPARAQRGDPAGYDRCCSDLMAWQQLRRAWTDRTGAEGSTGSHTADALGGIAAAMANGDRPALQRLDTLRVGGRYSLTLLAPGIKWQQADVGDTAGNRG